MNGRRGSRSVRHQFGIRRDPGWAAWLTLLGQPKANGFSEYRGDLGTSAQQRPAPTPPRQSDGRPLSHLSYPPVCLLADDVHRLTSKLLEKTRACISVREQVHHDDSIETQVLCKSYDTIQRPTRASGGVPSARIQANPAQAVAGAPTSLVPPPVAIALAIPRLAQVLGWLGVETHREASLVGREKFAPSPWSGSRYSLAASANADLAEVMLAKRSANVCSSSGVHFRPAIEEETCPRPLPLVVATPTASKHASRSTWAGSYTAGEAAS